MERSIVEEIMRCLWDVGQAAEWVSPAIPRVIKVSESRLGGPGLSDPQRNAYAGFAFGARIIGGLQIFQVLTDDKPPKKLGRTFISQ